MVDERDRVCIERRENDAVWFCLGVKFASVKVSDVGMYIPFQHCD